MQSPCLNGCWWWCHYIVCMWRLSTIVPSVGSYWFGTICLEDTVFGMKIQTSMLVVKWMHWCDLTKAGVGTYKGGGECGMWYIIYGITHTGGWTIKYVGGGHSLFGNYFPKFLSPAINNEHSLSYLQDRCSLARLPPLGNIGIFPYSMWNLQTPYRW